MQIIAEYTCLQDHNIDFLPIEAGSQNTNYFIQVLDKKKYIFTIFEEFISCEDIPYFIDFIDFLKEHGDLPVAGFLKNKSGNKIFDIKIKNQNKKAIIVDFLKGESLKKIDKIHMKELAMTIASLHQTSSYLSYKHRNKHFNLSNLVKFNKDKIKDSQYQKFVDGNFSNILSLIKSFEKANLTKIHIHGDAFIDNFLFQDNKITGIIDFYMSGYEFLLYEIATIIISWCFEFDIKTKKLTYHPELKETFLQEYKKTVFLSEEEWQYLPDFLQVTAFSFLLFRLQNNSIEINQEKDPEEFKQIYEFFIEN